MTGEFAFETSLLKDLENAAAGVSRLGSGPGSGGLAVCGGRRVRAPVPPVARSPGALRCRQEIAGLLQQLHKLYPDVAFAPADIRVLVETPEKTLAEFVMHATAAATG